MMVMVGRCDYCDANQEPSGGRQLYRWYSALMPCYGLMNWHVGTYCSPSSNIHAYIGRGSGLIVGHSMNSLSLNVQSMSSLC